MSLPFWVATDNDLPLLAQMNKRLIEDGGSHNPMSVEQLQLRMSSRLHSERIEWAIQLFLEDEAVIGYAVFRLQPDDYYPEKQIVYLKQFYIEREKRS
jgi:hypothetical protein